MVSLSNSSMFLGDTDGVSASVSHDVLGPTGIHLVLLREADYKISDGIHFLK